MRYLRRPLEGLGLKEQIQERHHGREQDDCDRKSVLLEQAELPVKTQVCDRRGVNDPCDAVVRRGLWVRDHEEGEKQDRAVL